VTVSLEDELQEDEGREEAKSEESMEMEPEKSSS
jgi:hypothetical protein